MSKNVIYLQVPVTNAVYLKLHLPSLNQTQEVMPNIKQVRAHAPLNKAHLPANGSCIFYGCLSSYSNRSSRSPALVPCNLHAGTWSCHRYTNHFSDLLFQTQCYRVMPSVRRRIIADSVSVMYVLLSQPTKDG